MKHFSEFEKYLLKEMTRLGLKIVSFDDIIQYSALFKNKKIALREILISGKATTVIYLRKRRNDGPGREELKDLAISFEIQELFNYLLKENLVVKIDTEAIPTWKLIGYLEGHDYMENKDHTIQFKNNDIIGKDNEWRDEHNVIKYESISISNQSLDVCSFVTNFVPTQQLLDFINNDFKDDDEIIFDFEKGKAKRQNTYTKLSIIAAFLAALSPLFLAKFCTNSVKISEPIEIDKASYVETKIQEINESLDEIRQGIDLNSNVIDSLTKTMKEKNNNANDKTKRK